MKVRLTTDRVVGLGAIQRQGDVVEVKPDEAARLLTTRQAEPVDLEHAVVGPPENASRRGRAPKRPGA